jgi:Glucose / Sorbosone dehydrogenase
MLRWEQGQVIEPERSVYVLELSIGVSMRPTPQQTQRALSTQSPMWTRVSSGSTPGVDASTARAAHCPLRLYADRTVAPSGTSFVTLSSSAWSGSLVMAGLRSEELRRLSIDGHRISAEELLLEEEFGRLRTVAEGPDGTLYALTSNRDGRGTPRRRHRQNPLAIAL